MKQKLSKSKLNQKSKKIELIAMDVDGVLTGGEIIFTGNEKEIKIWNVRDGLCFTILKRLGGIKLAWITGRASQNVLKRSKDLKIDYVIQKCLTKKQAMDKIIKKSGIDFAKIAYIGDDLVDIPVLESVGLAICPQDAAPEVKQVVHHIVPVNGGQGVFRYTAEIILKAQGKWKKALTMFY